MSRKRVHILSTVIAGAGIAFVVTLLVVLMTTALAPMLPLVLHPLSQPVPAALLGLVAGERAGRVKEYVWDAAGRGTVDRGDYLWTGRGAIAGALAGALVVALLMGAA